MSTYTQQDRHLALTTVLGSDTLLVHAFSGKEAISQPFSFDFDLLSENDAIDLKTVTGTKATMRVVRADGSPRYWNGYISRIIQGWRGRVFTSYKAEMVPWLWLLGLKRDCRIFQDKTAPEIITQVFTDLGFQDFTPRLHGDFLKREYCVQYRETDLQFVSRLMEEEGIFYFFEHEATKHNLVLANTPEAHQECPNQPTARCRQIVGARQTEDVITDWRMEEEYISSGSALADYNFKTPTTDLKVSLDGETPFQIYDHPGIYLEKGRGETLARIRLEETKSFATVGRGESTCRAFTTGYRFKLREHYREDWNQSYVLTEVRHRGTQGGDYLSESISNQQEAVYQNDFVCIPYSTPFRPPRHTPVPVVEGCQTAVVVGPSGEEIYTDKLGRVKVQFHWDRVGQKNEKSSCWIRVAQSWAGKGWGAVSLPRIGQEVVVDFLEGNPDQPIIVGSVYNSDQTPPYTLPDEKTKSTIKSNSSKGSDGFNELRFEDAKGNEQVFLHAERNQDIRVKKDLFETVGEESHRTVGKNHLEEIGGDKHLAVKGDQNEKIDGTVSLKAGVDYQANVGEKYALEAGMEIHQKAGLNFVLESGTTLTLKAGGSFINLNPAGVFISGPMVMLNSGGMAGTGSGASPHPPNIPKAAAMAIAGLMSFPKPQRPPKPKIFSPAALVMKNAAKSGTPFCAICERAKLEAQRQTQEKP